MKMKTRNFESYSVWTRAGKGFCDRTPFPFSPYLAVTGTRLLGSLTGLAAKELKLEYHNPETILSTRYPYYGNLM